MVVVWAVFLTVAVVLAVLSVVGLRWRGAQAPVFHRVGGHLLVLSVGTAVYPFTLKALGPGLWAAVYLGFVVMLTLVATCSAVRRARTPKAR